MQLPFLLLVLQCILVAACAPQTVSSDHYLSDTGNAAIDRFIDAVQRRNQNDVQSQIAKFETISGLYPQYSNAKEYLDWTKGCAISRVVQSGSDSNGEPVFLDRSLATGPRAAAASYVYWILWNCPQGKFRQALNADFMAPKIMVAEMLPPIRELPLMRPPPTLKSR